MKSITNWIIGLLAVVGIECTTINEQVNTLYNVNSEQVEEFYAENKNAQKPVLFEKVEEHQKLEQSKNTEPENDNNKIFERILQLLLLVITAVIQWLNSADKFKLRRKRNESKK